MATLSRTQKNDDLMMGIEQRIASLSSLGYELKSKTDELEELYIKAKSQNPWFTIGNQRKAIENIIENYLDAEKLRSFTNKYNLPANDPKRVGLILAGNIPLVGFHDLLCVYLAGHHAHYKLSDKDAVLMPFILRVLEKIDPDTLQGWERVDKLNQVDAIIGTGSDNTAKHLEYYFRDKARLIRKNRHGVAVLGPEDDQASYGRLSQDVFSYFGLGCRNVSKVYVPESFDFVAFMDVMHEHKQLINHNKYKNNFDYNYAIYMMNKEKFFMSGSLLLRQHQDISSRIACLHYEEYSDKSELSSELQSKAGQIQCVVSDKDIPGIETIPLGSSQSPRLDQYADGVDTLEFLTSL